MNNPKPEHRITAVEKRVTHLEGATEELASDTAEELKTIRQAMHQGFEQAHAFVQERFESTEKRLDRIEATMATKEDLSQLRDELAAMESRLIDAMKMLFSQKTSE